MTEQEHIDELLKPRVIVENLWPGAEVQVGDIFIKQLGKSGKWYYRHQQDGFVIPVEDVEPYPYLMRPLKWWEKRKEDEVPIYVKGLKSVKKVLKIEDHDGEFPSILCEGEQIWGTIFMFLPATSQEYHDYINSKK